MTLYDFIALNDNQKAEATWDGIFLEARIDNDKQVLLYSIGSFFVEVYYDVEKNEIESLRPFRNIGPIEPYLTGISLERLT